VLIKKYSIPIKDGSHEPKRDHQNDWTADYECETVMQCNAMSITEAGRRPVFPETPAHSTQESRAVARKLRDAAAVLFGLKFANNIH